MPHGGVAGRYVVQAMRLGGRRAAVEVGERAASGKPHDELDAFGARLAQVVDVGDVGHAFGVVDHALEEGVVPFGVDQAGAGAL